MPELPEVETTRRGILSALSGAVVEHVDVRDRRLRWPVPAGLEAALAGATISTVDRRAKYLLTRTSRGTLILHLGMSGSLRLVGPDEPGKLHDHVAIDLDSGLRLVFNDPRRFGCALWTPDDPLDHPLLRDLGPEPLGDDFDGRYLHRVARGRRVAIKSFIMNAHVVVGVGNIYASESLFAAGIHPARAAGRIARSRMTKLVEEIRAVLAAAIEDGGTTLRDFYGTDGTPGYFAQQLSVYDRQGEACRICGRDIRRSVLGQRATYYCLGCQH